MLLPLLLQVEWVQRVEFLWDHIPKVRAQRRAVC